MVRLWTRLARVTRRRACAAAAGAALALAALAAAARALAPPALSRDADFPRVRAAHLAHLLADLTAHTLTVPGSWTLEEEAGNYTSWRYAVSYECGARCAGRTRVEAHELRARGPRHGLAPAHLVRVTRTHCRRPPLLPWPTICDEMETESVVTSVEAAGGAESGAEGGAGGARLAQRWRARCGAAAALLSCAAAADLRRASDLQLQRLRHQLHNRDHSRAR